MKTSGAGLQLRIFLLESVRCGHQPLYAALVERARREGLLGATVFRGIEGFGRHRHLHTARLVDVSDDLPMIVEFIDQEARIRRFLSLVEGKITQGTATLSPVHLVRYRAGS